MITSCTCGAAVCYIIISGCEEFYTGHSICIYWILDYDWCSGAVKSTVFCLKVAVLFPVVGMYVPE